MLLDVAAKELEGLFSYFEKYREIWFTTSFTRAKEVAKNY